jgi:hypothetical protein
MASTLPSHLIPYSREEIQKRLTPVDKDLLLGDLSHVQERLSSAQQSLSEIYEEALRFGKQVKKNNRIEIIPQRFAVSLE